MSEEKMENGHNHEGGCCGKHNHGAGCGHHHGHEGHEHGEGCGHDHDHDHSGNIVTLSLDNGEDLQCSVLGIFDVEDKEYIALLPMGDEAVLLYKFEEVNGQPDLSQIDDDAEYSKVAEVFTELFMGGEDDDEEEEN